jgi:hypothetical protein
MRRQSVNKAEPLTVPFCSLTQLQFPRLYEMTRRSQWPRGLRRGSAATRLLRLLVRIPQWAWVSVECCVSSGRNLCDGLITRPDGSYRLRCVVVCDLGTSRGGHGPCWAAAPQEKQNRKWHVKDNSLREARVSAYTDYICAIYWGFYYKVSSDADKKVCEKKHCSQL